MISSLLLPSRGRELSVQILKYLRKHPGASANDVAQSVLSGLKNGRARARSLLTLLLEGGFVRQVREGHRVQWSFVRELPPLAAEVLEECIPHLCAYATLAIDEDRASHTLARSLRHVRSIVASKRLDEGIGHEDLDPHRGGLVILADEIENLLQAPVANTGLHA